MPGQKFRVGIIGADTRASWAGASHVPALKSQSSLVLAAVATGETSAREVPDHVDLIAKTSSGAAVSVQVLANVPAENAGFRFEIRGSDGWLTLSGHHIAGVQVGDLTLTSSAPFAAPDAPVANGVGPTAAGFWAGAAINVGEVYASLGRDLVAGSFKTPGFAHALHNSRLVAAVARAAETGERQKNVA